MTAHRHDLDLTPRSLSTSLLFSVMVHSISWHRDLQSSVYGCFVLRDFIAFVVKGVGPFDVQVTSRVRVRVDGTGAFILPCNLLRGAPPVYSEEWQDFERFYNCELLGDDGGERRLFRSNSGRDSFKNKKHFARVATLSGAPPSKSKLKNFIRR
jgi:hypothetical protein